MAGRDGRGWTERRRAMVSKRDLVNRIKSNFPQDLLSLAQWVCWRIEVRDDKPTKVPYSVNGQRAASDNPATWASFDAACKAFLNGNYNGVGFMFSEHDPYIGIDFDKCIQPDGTIDQAKLKHFFALNSYTERSQSGTGAHIIVKGLLPPGGRKSNQQQIEIYDRKRFFVVTGDCFDGYSTKAEERQAQIEQFHKLIFPAKEQATQQHHTNGNGQVPADDQALLDRMFSSRNGADIQALWNGDKTPYNGDESAADLALCNYLAFWTGNDAARMDRMFRQSRLYRDHKWNRPARTGEKYGEGTIARAIAATKETYSPRRQTTGEIHAVESVAPAGYTNGNGSHNHTEQPAKDGYAKEAPPVNKVIGRRTYPQLLNQMQAKAISEYNEYFTITCLFNGEEGDATLLSSILQGNVVYDHSEGIWYWYNNLYWEPDKTWNIYQLTSDILSEIYKHLSIKKHTESIELEKALLTNDNATQEQRDELKKIISISKAAKGRAVALNAINDVKRVLNFACAGLRLGISGNEWDSNVNLLGVENCVIDLKVGEPVQPKADQYIRTVAPVPYHKEWKSPLWEKSLVEIFDNKVDDADYVQRLLGYAMSGTCVESDFPIWYGKEGRNGKEFILERIRNVLGEKLAGVAESELLLSTKQDRGKNSSTEGLMVLRGRRIAWASETNEGRMLDLASMKDLSGGHILTGRHNHGKQVEWKRTHTLILLTNHRPHIQSQALAEWDRVRLLEFPLSFVNNPDPEKPNQRLKDKTLGERIDRDELPGILNWLIAGCLAWRCTGLSEPESVKRATAQYKQDEDTLGHFIKETCIVQGGAKCKPIDLYKAYVEWIDRGGKPMGKKTFYTKIEERGFKRFLSMGFEYFEGIGILAM